MSWQDSEDYKRQRADLERVHQISANLRETNPELRKSYDTAIVAYDLVLLEMGFAGGRLNLAMNVADLVYKWKTEGNTYYMDHAMLMCATYGVTPPPTLLKMNAEAAHKRYTSGHGALKSTSDSIKNKSNKHQAFMLMANLIHYGEPQERAASKAAQWMMDVLKVNPIKASSLEKYYIREIRKTGLEKELFERWTKWRDEDISQQWKQVIQALPESGDQLKGSRR